MLHSLAGHGWGNTPNAFIFSLHNKEDLPFKTIVSHPNMAIYSQSDYGPTFGGAHDINIKNNANTVGGSYTHFGSGSYPVPPGVRSANSILAGTNGFMPEEVEVFYVG